MTRRKQDRLRRFYRRVPGVDLEKVEGISRGRQPLPADISAIEMVAVLALLSKDNPFDVALKKMTRFSEEGWSSQFTAPFFAALEQTVLDFSRLGFDKEAQDLLKFGEVTARMQNQIEWANRFQRQIEKGLQARIRELPFLRQHGW